MSPKSLTGSLVSGAIPGAAAFRSIQLGSEATGASVDSAGLSRRQVSSEVASN